MNSCSIIVNEYMYNVLSVFTVREFYCNLVMQIYAIGTYTNKFTCISNRYGNLLDRWVYVVLQYSGIMHFYAIDFDSILVLFIESSTELIMTQKLFHAHQIIQL